MEAEAIDASAVPLLGQIIMDEVSDWTTKLLNAIRTMDFVIYRLNARWVIIPRENEGI